MLLFLMPTFFASIWFWAGIVAIIIAIHYFWGKAPPPPKPSKFLLKYKKTLNKLTDALIILLVLLFSLLSAIPEVSSMRRALSDPEPLRAVSLDFAIASLFYTMIVATGILGCLGLLSIFHSNLTPIKRVLLLAISLLPISFTILVCLSSPVENRWLVFKLGLAYSFFCWFINGPAIILAKPTGQFWWTVMRALRLVSGDLPS